MHPSQLPQRTRPSDEHDEQGEAKLVAHDIHVDTAQGPRRMWEIREVHSQKGPNFLPPQGWTVRFRSYLACRAAILWLEEHGGSFAEYRAAVGSDKTGEYVAVV